VEIKAEFTLGGLDYSFVLPTIYSWYELEAKGFKFEDGWVVPKRSQLIELFDSEEKARDNSYLWSASAYAYDGDYAWVVYFGYGVSNGYYDFRTYSYGVRLVRELKDGN